MAMETSEKSDDVLRQEDGRVEGGAEPLPHPESGSVPPPPRGGERAASASQEAAPPLAGVRRRVARTVRAEEAEEGRRFTPGQRLLLLESWVKSRLPATEFGPLVGVSSFTLYGWKKKFEARGPAGLEDRVRGGPKGSRLPEPTRRAILMLKESHPDWG
jgi:hypothetical protein